MPRRKSAARSPRYAARGRDDGTTRVLFDNRIWILGMLLFLSATGITWSLYAGATVADIRAAFGWQRPQLDTALTTHQDTGPIDLDGVVSATNTVGVRAPLEFSLPAEPGQAAGVTEIHKAYRLTTNSAPVDPATLR